MNPVRVETASGIKIINKFFADGDKAKVASASVDMGEPILVPADIPVALPTEQAEPIVNLPLDVCCTLDNATGWMESAGLEKRHDLRLNGQSARRDFLQRRRRRAA